MIFRSFANVTVASSESNRNTFFNSIIFTSIQLIGRTLLLLIGENRVSRAVKRILTFDSAVVVAVVNWLRNNNRFLFHQASHLALQDLLFMNLGSGCRDGERKTHVSPFVGNRISFIANESRAIIRVLVAGDIAEEGDAGNEHVLHDEHVDDDGEED